METNNKPHIMDVYFVSSNCETATAAIVDIYRSWDDSLYAETNVRDLAGPNRVVVGKNLNSVATIDGNPLNCPAHIPRQ